MDLKNLDFMKACLMIAIWNQRRDDGTGRTERTSSTSNRERAIACIEDLHSRVIEQVDMARADLLNIPIKKSRILKQKDLSLILSTSF